MKKLILLTILTIIPLLRYYVTDFKKSRHLLVSFFVTSIPFQIAFPFYKINSYSIGGAIGNTFQILLPMVLSLILIPTYNFKISEITFDKKSWPIIFLILFALSIINPLNDAKGASIILFVFVLSHFIFFKVIGSSLTEDDVIKGTFDGLIILCAIQFILAICFPLLGISAVTGLFYDIAENGSTRSGTRPGAVGTFTYPGNLALFISIASSFLLGSYLTNYRKKTSLIFLLLNGITVFLTYSRTSYITLTFNLLFIYFIFKNVRNNIFSIGNIFKFLIPIIIILGWVIFFSPFSDIFLKSDAEEMYLARLAHFLMAFDIFESSPLIGAGMNAHLEYFASHSVTMNSIDLNNTFLMANPIHNIHLIVLAENGIFGLIFWLSFFIYNINEAKVRIANDSGNKIFQLSLIGLLVSFAIYGITGWAPFSSGILPFFLYFTFFATKYSIRKPLVS